MKSKFALIAFLSLLSACINKTEDFRNEPFEIDLNTLKAVKIIGHKGSGDGPTYGYKDFIGNSTQSVTNAFEKIDGSEIDIQISKDSTLWVFHDHQIKGCSDSSYYNISTLSDSTIHRLSICKYKNQLTTLSSLTEALESRSFNDKILSLDLKVLQNNTSIELFGGRSHLLHFLAKELSKYDNLSKIEVLIEVPREEDMALFLANTKLTPYLLATNQEKITKSKYDHFSADIMIINPKLRKKAKKLQLWTVNSAEQMVKAIALNPDYIQTDNIAMAEFFKKMIVNKIHDTLLISNYNESSKDEFIHLITFDSATLSENFILDVSLKAFKHQSNVSYVLSGKDSNGNSVIWEGVKLDESVEHTKLNFVNGNKLNCSQLKIYLWNREKKEVSFDSLFIQKYYF